MKNILLLAILLLSLNMFAQRKGFKVLTEKNGKIGIGTNAPDELLTVKGKIHSQEVLVDLNGAIAPDYVFENYFDGKSELRPDYIFPSLKDVAEFIEKNHHLPDIPSAKQFERDGLSLKEMNLLLLQKVEELTIYAIEQQKAIETLNSKFEDLKTGK